MFLTVYRYSMTGVFGYAAFDGNRKLFDISSDTSWNPAVYISTEDGRYNFHSTFDREITLIPGITSRTIRNRSESPAATIRLERDELHSLICPENQYLIENRDGKYLAFTDRQCVFAMKRTSSNARVPAAVQADLSMYEVEPYFTVTTAPEIPLPTAMILTAFPMLRFG